MPSEERPDRGRTDPDPELAQLALDPHAAPARILRANITPASEAPSRAAAGPSSTPKRPLPTHQLALPTQKRLRRHDEHRPSLSRQQATGRGEDDPITPAQLRLFHRPPKHTELVPKHRVLDLE